MEVLGVVSAFEMPEDIPLPGTAGLCFPFHLAVLGLVDRAELQAFFDRKTVGRTIVKLWED